LPLAAFLFFGRPLTDGLKSVVLLAAGFLIVPLGFAFYFLADGDFGAFFADAVIAAVGRVSVFHLGWNDTFTGLLLGLMLMLPLIILAAAACVFPGGSKSSALPFVAAWTAGALGGVLATRAALVIYFLPLLQPLCLMAAAFVQHSGTRIPGRKRLVMAAAIHQRQLPELVGDRDASVGHGHAIDDHRRCYGKRNDEHEFPAGHRIQHARRHRQQSGLFRAE
jgi:hypothetical protein